jgi:hypothetical protein
MLAGRMVVFLMTVTVVAHADYCAIRSVQGCDKVAVPLRL